MDSRVILNRIRRRESVSLEELEQLKKLQPELRADGTVHRTSRVSVIVPTFFNSDLKSGSLRHLLTGIEAARSVEQVVIVASGGEDALLGTLKEVIGDRTLTVAEAEPHNRGGSRNVGAAAATGEYLLFLDDDMLLKDWRCVDVVLSALLTGGFECAMFPRRQYARFPLLYDPPSLAAAIGRWREHGVNGDPLVYDPLHEGTPDLPMLFCFPGCFMIIHREAFASLAGFDSSFQGWGFEDTDFALRAIRRLRVLNLFSRAEPLLHIDHPVSPYKSDEHRVNYEKYFSSSIAVDVHRFCRTVLRCSDFTPQVEQEPVLEKDIHVQPFTQLAAAGIPLDPQELEEWAAGVAEKRMHALLSPRPEFIVLHGSRASGRATARSDYDVLCVYRGPVHEFFVTKVEPRVEIECGDFDVFNAIAAEPAQYGMHGVLELAKLAQARLLWGDAEKWSAWQSQTLDLAIANGHAYWLVLTLGLRLHATKYGAVIERFCGSLRAVVESRSAVGPAPSPVTSPTGATACRTAGEAPARLATAGGGCPTTGNSGEVQTADVARLAESARAALDARTPDWRERLADGRKVFTLQIPEVWSALYHLADEAAPLPRTRTPRLPGERYLFAASSSGLGNRLLLLAGCLRVAERTNRRLLLHWPDNDQLGSPFDALFENHFDMVDAEDLNFLLRSDRTVKVYNTWRQRGPLYTDLDPEGDPDTEVVIVKGWVASQFAGEKRNWKFDEEIVRHLRTLTPCAEFKKLVDEFGLPARTVGVHMRRGDPTREFIDEYRRSEDAHFLAIMRAVLEAAPDVHFFLATDHPPTEEHLRGLFGERILLRPKTSLLRHRQAMHEAMMDFLLLSRTAAVIGTHFSTFSEVSAKFGACPLIIANENSATEKLGASVEQIVAALSARTTGNGAPSIARPVEP